MDPVRNPFAPGAGNPPVELAGRSDIIEMAQVALARIASGRHDRSIILVGLRGVGKTVLLREIDREARSKGFLRSFIEIHEGKSLSEMLVPRLREMLFAISKREQAREAARYALRVLKGFVNGLNVTIEGVTYGLSIDPEEGVADSGDLEADLPRLISVVGEAARDAEQPMALFFDELQYLDKKEFSALIMAIHRASQEQLPIIMAAAGLPQTLALAGNSKSCAERLFRYLEIGPLEPEAARHALVEPARQEKVVFEAAALDEILEITRRYPYFLQQWGFEAWNCAKGDVIRHADIEAATSAAIEELDQSFFKVRFDRCTPAEKKYLRALAELGDGNQRSGEVADILRVKVTALGLTRSNLIKKGMIYAPAHGETAFTVPMFDKFMKRTMPELER